MGPVGRHLAPILVAALATEPADAVAAPPVLVVGADGLTFDVIGPMRAAGRLPNIDRMMREGCHAVLVSEKPMRSPALWTTIATGTPRAEHGIYDFVTGSAYWPARLRTSEQKLVTSRMRKTPAVWQLAGLHGRRSLVIGWLNTWPAERVDGVMVAPYVALNERRQTSIKGRIYKRATRQSYPDALFAEVAPLVVTARSVPAEALGRIVQPPAPTSALVRQIPILQRYLYAVRWSLASTLTNTTLVERIAAQHGPFDLVMTYFDGSDTLAHRFWAIREPLAQLKRRMQAHGIDPALAPELKRCFGGAVDGYYVLLDQMIGRLQAALGPDVVTLVVSDHGWGSYPGPRSPHESVPFDGRHEIEGVMIAHGPEIARAELEQLTLYDVAPLILYLTDVPVPERLSGRVPTAAIEPRALAARPIRRATGPVGPTRDGEPVEPPHEESEIERLRSLGYVQ